MPVPEQYADVQPGNIVVAYFTNWDCYGKQAYKVEDIYPVAHKLTHIIYAFACPNKKTGICELHDPWCDVGANLEYRKKLGGNFAKLKELKRKFPHIKILLSIGGGVHSKYISQVVQNGKDKEFVESAVKLLDRYEYTFKNSKTLESETITFEYEGLFDGLDFDWEWVNNVVSEQDARAYQNMIVLLRQLLKERADKQKTTSLLTVALQVKSSVYKKLGLDKVSQYVDWFHVMTYNFTSPVSSGIGFNAPICNAWSSYSVDNAIHGIMLAGVSPQQIVLGVPLYGHVFDQTRSKIGSPFIKTDITDSLSYNKIKELYVTNKSCQYAWNEKSSVPYMYCPDDKVFVSFDDERSVKEKVQYARLKKLKGIVFWKLSGDDKQHSLIHAI